MGLGFGVGCLLTGSCSNLKLLKTDFYCSGYSIVESFLIIRVFPNNRVTGYYVLDNNSKTLEELITICVSGKLFTITHFLTPSIAYI